jgi:hypothetical protein
VDNSGASRAITIVQGQASAESTRIVNEAEAFTKNLTISSQATAYQLVSNLTNQTSSDTLMDYIYYTNLLNVKNATILVGVDRAMVSMGA